MSRSAFRLGIVVVLSTMAAVLVVFGEAEPVRLGVAAALLVAVATLLVGGGGPSVPGGPPRDPRHPHRRKVTREFE